MLESLSFIKLAVFLLTLLEKGPLLSTNGHDSYHFFLTMGHNFMAYVLCIIFIIYRWAVNLNFGGHYTVHWKPFHMYQCDLELLDVFEHYS